MTAKLFGVRISSPRSFEAEAVAEQERNSAGFRFRGADWDREGANARGRIAAGGFWGWFVLPTWEALHHDELGETLLP